MKKLKLDLKKSYPQTIKNSVGAKVWRNFYAFVDGEKRDILKNGEFSCASFVSSVLLMFGLIKERHATVRGTLKDMIKNGWREVKKIKPGAVLIWQERKASDKQKHPHIGFFIGEQKAVSNSHKHKSPQMHHITYGKKKDGSPKRKIEKIFWHKKLEQ